MDFQSDSPDPPQSNGEASELGATMVPDRRSARQLANRAFVAVKAQHAKDRGPVEQLAQTLNDVASSTPFLVVHVVWFLIWISWNVGLLGLLGLRPFDPYPFGLLTMVVSLEAIFLSIFVLLAQKREAAIAELREEIALQVGLWTELEVTKTLQLVTGLYRRLGHPIADDPDLKEMLRPLDVKGIEKRLVKQIEQTQRTKPPKDEKKPAE
jgi:uncharacterized membrane protein